MDHPPRINKLTNFDEKITCKNMIMVSGTGGSTTTNSTALVDTSCIYVRVNVNGLPRLLDLYPVVRAFRMTMA